MMDYDEEIIVHHEIIKIPVQMLGDDHDGLMCEL